MGIFYRYHDIYDSYIISCQRRNDLLKSMLKESSVPLYLQVASLLRRRIEVGDWPAGHKIPKLEDLAQEFDVARITARQAVSILQAEGLIWRRQGKGTFVSDSVRDRRWINLASDWPTLLRRLEGTKVKLLSTFDTIEGPRLQGGDGMPVESYHHSRRLHSKDKVPHLLIDIYLDRRVFLKAPDELKKKPIIPILDTLPDVEISTARQTLTIGTADLEIASLLDIAVNDPVVEVHRTFTNGEGEAFFIADLTYRADFIKMEIDLLSGRETK